MHKKKLGIALGGGGAKGIAHLGALEIFSQEGIEFDIVTGTSIGSLVGGFYSASRLDILKSLVSEVRLIEIPKILSPSWSVRGIFSGQNVLELLEENIGVHLIEELDRKFAAVCVDLKTSNVVNFTSGKLVNAIRASIAVPAIFTPVNYQDKILVDGALLEPVPVNLARSLGADIVIAIDLFGDRPTTESEKKQIAELNSTLWPAGIISALNYLKTVSSKLGWSINQNDKNEIPNIISIIEQTLAVSQRELTSLKLKQDPPDFVLQPAVGKVGFLDFHRAAPIMEIGRHEARKFIPAIKNLLS